MNPIRRTITLGFLLPKPQTSATTYIHLRVLGDFRRVFESVLTVLCYCVPFLLKGAHHRTKTVHKTLQPVFNETLTFYGLLQTDLAWQTLQINVMGESESFYILYFTLSFGRNNIYPHSFGPIYFTYLLTQVHTLYATET